MGIRVLPPDVNESVATFAPVGKDIRFGLAAIRNVGVNVVEAIITARKSKDQFTGFSDFLRKVPLVVCNKRVIESLIKAGAFDSFQDARKGLVLVHEQAVDAVIDIVAMATHLSGDRVHHLDAVIAAEEKKSAAYLQAIAKRLAGVSTEQRILRGHPAEAILETTTGELNILIAMATHGRSGAQRWLLGSVAEKVIRAARGPGFKRRV
jgi:DNA polymerase III alpha subunit